MLKLENYVVVLASLFIPLYIWKIAYSFSGEKKPSRYYLSVAQITDSFDERFNL